MCAILFIRSRPYTTAFVAFLLALVPTVIVRTQADWQTVYVPAARRMMAGDQLFLQGYFYPPIMAWLAIPFTPLPDWASRLAWFAVCGAALVVVTRSAWTLAGGGRLEGGGVLRREHLIAVLGLCCGWPFVCDALTNVQNDLIVAALMFAGCGLLLGGRAIRAAALFGVAAGIKCTPLLWSPYLAWRRQWRAAVVVPLVAVGVNLLPDLTHPSTEGGTRVAQWFRYFITPMAGSTYQPGLWAASHMSNHSVAGAALRWSSTRLSFAVSKPRCVAAENPPTAKQLKAVVYPTYLLLLAAALVTSWRRGPGMRNEVVEFGLVLILMLMLSPQSSKPHFATLLLPGFCLARIALEGSDRRLAMLLGMAVFAGVVSNRDLVGPFLYPALVWVDSVLACALALFVGCCLALRPQPAAAVPAPVEQPRARAA